jgi:hypothetical protein
MKILAVSALLALPAVPQDGHLLAPLGPIGHWKGDDGAMPTSAADATGNGRHGAFAAGAGTSTDVPPVKFENKGCFVFDGKAGAVTVPDHPDLRLTRDITISLWKRKTAEVPDWVRLVGKGGGPRNYGIWEYPGAEGKIKFQMYNQNGGSVLELDSPQATEINKWHHILCVISIHSAAMYINGQPVAHGMRTGEPGISNEPLTIGHAGYHTGFPGQIDDVRLYARALSMSEIAYLAAGHGAPKPPADLKAARAAAGGVELTWSPTETAAPAGTVTTYLVKRSTPGAETRILAKSWTSTSFVDADAPAGQACEYVVTAVNTGGESGPSNAVKAP